MANVQINTAVVDSELTKIDGYIDQLNQLYQKVNPDLTGGWDSATSKTIISPKIEQIKNSIDSISQSILRVRNGVSSYSTGIQEVDTAGARAASGGGASNGSSVNMLN